MSKRNQMVEKVCSVCGKKFIPVPKNYMYRAKRKWQCGYDHYRKEGGDDGKYSYSKLLNNQTE